MYFGTLYRIYDVINKTVTYLSQVAVTPVPVLAAASKVAFSPAEKGGGVNVLIYLAEHISAPLNSSNHSLQLLYLFPWAVCTVCTVYAVSMYTLSLYSVS